MIQSQRTLQEYRCTLPPSEVLARAKEFFSQRNSLYASFLDTEGRVWDRSGRECH